MTATRVGRFVVGGLKSADAPPETVVSTPSGWIIVRGFKDQGRAMACARLLETVIDLSLAGADIQITRAESFEISEPLSSVTADLASTLDKIETLIEQLRRNVSGR